MQFLTRRFTAFAIAAAAARVYTPRMRVRNAVAAILAVFFAGASSWAGACELSCSLGRMCDGSSTPAIAAAQPAAAHFSTAISEHCRHAMHMAGAESRQSAAQAPVHNVRTADSALACENGLASASASTEASRFDFQPSAETVSMAVLVVPAALLSLIFARDGSPPHFATFSPQSFSLRI
jgi:hypothetical protein